ncbi:DUF819 domain-containing protein [Algoriphagus sediminis]|uniref:DUF819 family protein n=1 Tax=Algoriphagus sediminis TaxID=3057113 RepID=A0ABT7Y8H0_9BACT|nr:DUF819 family protein [Algoriphagus sediminis]MDN3202820.1 DUF819 family protein [Algoriphagus sediminis]
MNFIQSPIYVAGMLCFFLFLSVWLGKFKWGRTIGSPILIILITAIAANIGIVPAVTDGNVIYDGIFLFLAPLGIFITLLEVNLKSIKNAGIPILLMFILGAVGTIMGVVISWWIMNPEKVIGEYAHVIAGMFTGTYIGGSINFNAVALHYQMNENADLFAATTVVDNLIGTPWIIITLILPKYLQKLLPRKKVIRESKETSHESAKEEISLKGLGMIFSLAFLALAFSRWMTDLIPAIPEIITLTTLALILAQIPMNRKLKGTRTLGFFLILLFLAAIGGLCDLSTLQGLGELAPFLSLFVGLIVIIHGLVIFGIGAVFRMDWDVVAVASMANVGGNTTALAAAESLERPDLLVPGILVGSLGNAIGTYAGFLVAGYFG